MLEGNEVENTYDNGAGTVIVDVTDKGAVIFKNNYKKDFGFAKVSNDTAVETDIFKIAEAIAAKTKTTLDDKAIAGLKSLLGIV